ncbi:MAG: protein-glutamate O-methyltransferase CheR [Bacteroidia bacterium]|nr:protein-glutamate O-methyltransferase CheR [Bacteroidia bacterium]
MEIRDEEIKEFIEIFASLSTYNFSDYSEKSFRRRMEKIVNDNNCTLTEIIKKAKNNSTFLEKIVRDITVNTTELFRDPKVWLEIQKEIIPKLKTLDSINLWHAGCSSGQELYSMLMFMNENGLLEKTNTIGTDINTEILEEAAKGNYKYRFNVEYLPNFDQVLNTISEKEKIPYSKYMDIDQAKDTIRIKPFLLNKASFLKHDLVKDKNIFGKKFDFIICRNVLIYFNNNLQNKIFDLFWENLNDDGFLVIGLHESIMGPASSKFTKKGQCYIKKPLNM